MEAHAHIFEQHLKHIAGGRVKLLVHDVGGQVNHVHFQPTVHQATRRFQAEQAATDYGCLPHVCRVFHHLRAFIQSAEREDTVSECAVVLVQPVHHRYERRTASGDHQLVVWHEKPARGVSSLRFSIYAYDAHARVQGDVVVLIP